MSGNETHSQPQRRGHGVLSAKLVLFAVAMFGFGYLMVPLYDIICDITGLNGKTGRVAESSIAGSAIVDREITVEFVAIVNAGGAWEFRPNETSMKVKPGILYKTSFYAENLSSAPVVGQASPSVSPSASAPYFDKTECFCFTRQEFDARSGRDMPLAFIVDPEVPPNIDRITLSYTFFQSADQS